MAVVDKKRGYVFRKKIIFVAGPEQALSASIAQSLAQDPSLRLELPAAKSELFVGGDLRPEPEIRRRLRRLARRIVLAFGPGRNPGELLAEFAAYQPTLVWVYRDPADTFAASDKACEIGAWIDGWRREANALLAAFGSANPSILLVRNDDLTGPAETAASLARRFGLEVVAPLPPIDASNGMTLDESTRRRIAAETAAEVAALDARRVRPLPDVGLDPCRPDVLEIPADAWRLDLRPGAAARAVVDPARPTSVRIEFDAPGNGPSDVQISHRPILVDAGRRYSLAFWTRADAPRKLAVSVGADRPPWSSFGPYRVFDVGTEWRRRRVEFVAEGSDAAARILFDLGGEAPAIELADVLLAPGAAEIRRLDEHEGASGTLRFDPKAPGVVRVEIAASPRRKPADLQLVERECDLEAGREYYVMFRARAEDSRPISVAVGQTAPPWNTLGMYQLVRLEKKWKTSRFGFVATESGPARLYFDLGKSEDSVELDRVVFREATPDQVRIAYRGASRGEIVFSRENPDSVAVAVTAADPEAPENVQLFHGRLAVEKGRRYGVAFRIRADGARRARVGVSQTAEPFANLGFFYRFEVGREWREFFFEFVAKENDPDARVHFDLGSALGKIEIAGARFGPCLGDLNAVDRADLRLAVAAARGNEGATP